jgi:hypothetical protein
MSQEQRGAALNGRPMVGARDALLTRIQDGLAATGRRGTGTRRCPCCAQPIRTGQPITAIHGTSVHVRCASARSPGSPARS